VFGKNNITHDRYLHVLGGPHKGWRLPFGLNLFAVKCCDIAFVVQVK
jgi:hypothetical protein